MTTKTASGSTSTSSAPAPESRVRLDSTQLSVVVLCSACPWWYGFGFDKEDGWTVGARHQARVHPGSVQASNALSQLRGRKKDFRASETP